MKEPDVKRYLHTLSRTLDYINAASLGHKKATLDSDPTATTRKGKKRA